VSAPNIVKGNTFNSLKGAYLAARNLPDRMLHHRRYLDARRRVTRLLPVRSILVVCHGNICRSPYLEAVLQRALPQVRVTSAGLAGSGRAAPEESLALAAKRGLDLSAFRSKPVARANASRSDLVIVMDSDQAAHLARVFRVPSARIFVAGDLDPIASPTRAIRDPWGQSIEVFGSSFDRLDRCARTLVSLIRGG
jgi:protein-tyrosine phosphatase